MIHLIFLFFIDYQETFLLIVRINPGTYDDSIKLNTWFDSNDAGRYIPQATNRFETCLHGLRPPSPSLISPRRSEEGEISGVNVGGILEGMNIQIYRGACLKK